MKTYISQLQPIAPRPKDSLTTFSIDKEDECLITLKTKCYLPKSQFFESVIALDPEQARELGEELVLFWANSVPKAAQQQVRKTMYGLLSLLFQQPEANEEGNEKEGHV